METTKPQQTEDLVALLRDGGLIVDEPGDPSRGEPPIITRYRGLLDPKGSESLGTRLAQELRGSEPTSILIWQSPGDIVLAYIVSKELGIRAIRSYDLNGLVEFDGSFGGVGPVALVADAFREAEPVRAMCALAEQQGQQVVAAAALVSVEGPGNDELRERGVPLVSLVDASALSQRGRSY